MRRDRRAVTARPCPASAPVVAPAPARYRGTMSTGLLVRLAPIVFVLLWSTGWLVAKYAAPHADPLTFLAVRFALATAAIAAVIPLIGGGYALGRGRTGHAVASGFFLHGFYLGGVWWAIAHGLPAGISALIAALQPLLTALLAPKLVGEVLSARRWAGVLIGLAGLVVALSPKLAAVDLHRLGDVAVPIAVNAVAMVSVTLGTFYQKARLQGGALGAIAMWQYVGAFLVVLPAAFLFEPMRIDWNPVSVATMAWSVIVLSLGAIGLLLFLIRRGEVSRAATLIYLIPPVAAVETFFLFGETLSLLQIGGMVMTVIGVWLASTK